MYYTVDKNTAHIAYHTSLNIRFVFEYIYLLEIIFEYHKFNWKIEDCACKYTVVYAHSVDDVILY